MTKINLREHYPNYYNTDYIIEVPDEVAAIMLEYDRLDAAYRRRTYYHKAHYSLDRGDGIEYEALFVSMTPCEIYERKVTMEQLHAAMASLPDKQAKRVYAHYFLGLTVTAIAKSEGVSAASVSESIQRGLRNMETFLKNRL
jgi:DNA-directed RNA polymerase specialized sigma24 family protein